MAGTGVLFQPVHRHILAIAGLFHAAVGHLRGQHEVGVDPGAAILQGGGTGHRLADILSPDGGGEAILGVVGEGDGLLEIIDRGDGDHGAN